MTNPYRRSFAAFALFIFISTNFLPAAFAQEAAAEAAQAATAATVNMDLASTEASVMVSTVGQAAAVHVEMGGTAVPITAGSMVTPAQFVALQQVMQTGAQTLILNSLGAAHSGTFAVDAALSSMMGNLTIPAGVTALHDAANAAMVNLAGNLVNSGNYYAYTSNASAMAASLAAQNITNNQSAIISTMLPAALQASLNPALANLSLNLTAINNIVNAGTISSSANLSLYAGGSITNALPPGATGPSPVMMAMQTLNMTAMNGAIQNAGVMAAMMGNINAQTAQTANLTFNNTAGVLQALNGAINIRDSLTAAKVNSTLTGGDYLSKYLNVFSGEGVADLAARNITGITNITAGAAHVTTDSGNLTLGAMNLSGDPTFFNTGDIQITGDIAVNESLTIIAGGDVYIPTGAVVNNIRANNTTNPSTYNVTIIAGANITNGSGSSSSLAGSPPPGGATTAVSISGPSATGGDIDFSTRPTLLISASLNGNSSGDVTLAAYSGTGGGGGHVIVPGVVNASGVFDKGNITIIAGAVNNTPIIVESGASVDQAIVFGTTTNFTSANGVITMITAQPSTTPLGFQTNGNPVGSNITAQTTLRPTNIQINNIVSADSIVVYAGGNITTAQDLTTLAQGQTLTLAAGGNVSLGDRVESNATPITIVAGGDISATAAFSITTQPSTNPTTVNGAITLVAGAAFSLDSTYDLAVSGGSATGGSVNLGNINVLRTNIPAFVGNANGGDIAVIAYANGASGGTITLPTSGINVTSNITGGFGTGANGNVTLIAGGPGPTTTINVTPNALAAFDTTGGTGGNGNVTIAAATPEIMCAGCTAQEVTFNTNGTRTGYFVAGALTDGGVVTNDIVTASNSLVQLYSDGSVNAGNVTACVGCALVGGSPTSSVTGCAGCTPVNNTNIPATTLATIAAVGAANVTIATVNNGSITLGTGVAVNISASNSVTFIAQGAGSIFDLLGSTITTRTLTALSGTGNVGSLADPINVIAASAQPLNITASGGGDVYIQAVGTVNLSAATAGSSNTYYLHTAADGNGNGQIRLNGSLSAPNGTVDLQSSSSGTGLGGIVGQVGFTGITADDISLFDVGTSTAPGAGDIYGLELVFGSVFPQQTSLKVSTSVLAVNTAGAMVISNTSANLTVNQLVASSYKLSTTGNLTIAGAVDSNGSLLLLAANGDLNIAADLISEGGAIVLIASGDISVTSAGVSITSTPTTNGSGGQISVIAGTTFVDTSGYTFLGSPSATGGNVNFDTGTPLATLSSEANTSGDGGDVNIIAFANGASGGVITLPSALTLAADGAGTGNNGNVLIVAGSLSGPSSIGSISSTNGTGGNGSVTFASASPQTINPLFSSDGVIITSTGINYLTGGAFLAGTLRGGAITVNGNIDSSGIVQLFSTNSVTVTGTVTAAPGCTGCIIAGIGVVNCPSCGPTATGTNIAINGPGPAGYNQIDLPAVMPDLFIETVGASSNILINNSFTAGDTTLIASGSVINASGSTITGGRIKIISGDTSGGVLNNGSITGSDVVLIASNGEVNNVALGTIEGFGVYLVTNTGTFINDGTVTSTLGSTITVASMRADVLSINNPGTLDGNLFFMNSYFNNGDVWLLNDVNQLNNLTVFANGDIDAVVGVQQINVVDITIFAGLDLVLPTLDNYVDPLEAITGRASSNGGDINFSDVTTINTVGFTNFFGARFGTGGSAGGGNIYLATDGDMTLDNVVILSEADSGTAIETGNINITAATGTNTLASYAFPNTANALPSAPTVTNPNIRSGNIITDNLDGGFAWALGSKGNTSINNVTNAERVVAATFQTMSANDMRLVTKLGNPPALRLTGDTLNFNKVYADGTEVLDVENFVNFLLSVINVNPNTPPGPPGPPPPGPPGPPGPGPGPGPGPAPGPGNSGRDTLGPTSSRADPPGSRQAPNPQTTDPNPGKTPTDLTPYDTYDIPDWVRNMLGEGQTQEATDKMRLNWKPFAPSKSDYPWNADWWVDAMERGQFAVNNANPRFNFFESITSPELVEQAYSFFNMSEKDFYDKYLNSPEAKAMQPIQGMGKLNFLSMEQLQTLWRVLPREGQARIATLVGKDVVEKIATNFWVTPISPDVPHMWVNQFGGWSWGTADHHVDLVGAAEWKDTEGNHWAFGLMAPKWFANHADGSQLTIRDGKWEATGDNHQYYADAMNFGTLNSYMGDDPNQGRRGMTVSVDRLPSTGWGPGSETGQSPDTTSDVEEKAGASGNRLTQLYKDAAELGLLEKQFQQARSTNADNWSDLEQAYNDAKQNFYHNHQRDLMDVNDIINNSAEGQKWANWKPGDSVKNYNWEKPQPKLATIDPKYDTSPVQHTQPNPTSKPHKTPTGVIHGTHNPILGTPDTTGVPNLWSKPYTIVNEPPQPPQNTPAPKPPNTPLQSYFENLGQVPKVIGGLFNAYSNQIAVQRADKENPSVQHKSGASQREQNHLKLFQTQNNMLGAVDGAGAANAIKTAGKDVAEQLFGIVPKTVQNLRNDDQRIKGVNETNGDVLGKALWSALQQTFAPQNSNASGEGPPPPTKSVFSTIRRDRSEATNPITKTMPGANKNAPVQSVPNGTRKNGLQYLIPVADGWDSIPVKDNSPILLAYGNSATASAPDTMSDAVSPMTEVMQQQIQAEGYNLDKQAVAVFMNSFEHPNIVQTSLGFVHCKKDTAIFVFDRERDVAIYVLESNGKDDVRVLMGDHFFNLRSGQQLLLSKDKTLAFNDINPVPNIGYRAAKDKGIINDTKVFLADFSIPSALISVKPLRQALTKPKTSADKRLGHALLKNSSILSSIGDADGPYKYSPVPNQH